MRATAPKDLVERDARVAQQLHLIVVLLRALVGRVKLAREPARLPPDEETQMHNSRVSISIVTPEKIDEDEEKMH